MTAPARPRARRRLVAALLLAGLALPAQADWRRDYGFGQQAIEKGNWAEAERLMKSAHAEEPGASVRKRMQGTRFELYAPAHYAAVAAFRQGACDRALQYLEDGATRGVVAQTPALAAEAQQVRSGCGGAQVAAEPQRPATPTPTPAPPPLAPKPAPAIADKPPQVAAEPVKPPVRAPEPGVVTPPVAAPSTPSAGGTPPTALRSIVRAFVAGDYAAAVKVSDAGIPDARARALVLLVRAAAWGTRAELTGDETMRTRAQQDIRASRKLARIDPDPNLFSPRMRALIAATR